MAGPYEFLADDPLLYGIHSRNQGATPPAEDARVALAAHNLLNAHVGWLSPKAATWLRSATGSIPRGFAEAGREPVTRIVTTPAGKVGLVLFPEGPVAGKGPGLGQEDAVLAAGRTLKGTVDLVVGVSPWGYVGERDFLPKAEGVFDCLLGSGEGVGFGATVPQKAPGVLWVRPDGQGRAVNILEIYRFPEPGQARPWTEGKTFGSSLEFLDETCPSDPAMQKLLGPAPGK